MLIAAILAGLALVAGCVVLHVFMWCVAAYADRDRDQQRRAGGLDISEVP